MRPSFRKNNPQLVFVCVCGILLFFSAGVFTYRHGSLIVHEEIKSILYESLTIDLVKRLKESDTDFVYGYDPNSSFDNTTVLTQDSTDILEYKPFTNVPMDSKIQNVIHTFLLQKRPIDTKSLDSAYTLSLVQRNITAQIAICYINNLTKETSNSKPNSKLYISSYALDEINLGMQHEITIQAFVKPSPICVIYKAKKQFILVYSTLLLLMGFPLYFVFRRKTTEVVPPTEEHKTAKDMHIDIDKQTLRYKDETVNLSRQSAKILKLLLKSPDHFIGYEDFENAIWGNLETGKDRREKAVKRLRESLDSIPELHIISIWGSGYQLIIGSKEEAEEAEKATDHSTTKGTNQNHL